MKKISTVSIALVLCLSLVACTVDQVLADINVGLQIAGALGPAIALVSPPDAAAVGGLVTLATNGLNVIKTDYDQWKASGAQTDLEKLQAAINTINGNLSSELNAAHIVSPKAVATVTAWDKILSSTFGAILALLPQFQAASTVRAKAAVAAKASVTLTPEGLQARWSAEVCQGEAKCAKLVAYHAHGKFARYATFGLLK